MRIEILTTDKIDRNAHFNLILESLASSPFKNIPNIEGVIDSHLQKIMDKPDRYLMVVAREENSGKLLGQLLIGLRFGDIGLIQAWQPIIQPDAERDVVATTLINYSKKVIASNNKTKMEIWMELASDRIKSMFPTYKYWYEQCGFQLSSDENNMVTTYVELKTIRYSIPKRIDVVPMVELPLDKVHEAVFKAFKDSKDQWVRNQSNEEIMKIIKSWMKVEESFHPESSIVFMEGGKIIGFNGMEIQENSVEIGPLGVLPSHRGIGLGKSLILESIKRLDSDHEESIILSVSTKNTPAINLYSSLGFKTQFQTLIYTWIPK